MISQLMMLDVLCCAQSFYCDYDNVKCDKRVLGRVRLGKAMNFKRNGDSI
jgi:hypothetical protein